MISGHATGKKENNNSDDDDDGGGATEGAPHHVSMPPRPEARNSMVRSSLPPSLARSRLTRSPLDYISANFG